VIDDVAPITATFELESEDRKALDERFGPGTISATRVSARRFYDNQLFVDLVDLVPDEGNAVRYLVERAALSPAIEPLMSGVQTFEALRSVLSELQAADGPVPGGSETANDIAALKLGLVRMLAQNLPSWPTPWPPPWSSCCPPSSTSASTSCSRAGST